MKKLLIVLLTLTLLVGMAVPASANVTLISQDNIELHATEYEIREITEPVLSIYVYAANNSAQKIWISADNIIIDGTPVRSSGVTLDPYSEYNDKSKYLMVITTDEDPDGSADAIRNARHVEMDLIAMDNSTYKRLFEKHVSLDLDSLNSGTANNSSTQTSSTSTSTSPSYAPAYTPASYNFQTLKMGSYGQAVIDLQQRLTDLGYLNDRVDGSYGQITAVAVMSFCTQNGLDIYPDASPEMQSLLYSSSAQYYEEPWVPLVMGPQYTFYSPLYAENDNGTLYFQVANRSNTRTVRGFEIYYYFTNIWGERYTIDGVEVTRKATLTQTIDPCYLVYAGPVPIYPYAWTYAVYVGIHKIVFDDGEIREIDPDDIQYFNLVVKE